MSETNGTSMVVDATRALEPANMGQAYKLAGALAASGLLGRDKARQEACFAIILAGRELGLTAMASLRSIHVIEGKTVLSADLIVALVRRSPDCEYLRILEWTGERCTMEGKRRGDPPVKLTWTMDDARAAKLADKDNWKKYGRAMLRSRCGTEIARALWPEIAMGLYDPDEIQEREPVRVAAQPVRSLDDMPDLGARADAKDRHDEAKAALAYVPECRCGRRFGQHDAEAPHPYRDDDSAPRCDAYVAKARTQRAAIEAVTNTPSSGTPSVIAEMLAPGASVAADGVPEADTEAAMLVLEAIHAAATLEDLAALTKRCRDLPKDVQRPVREAYAARKRALGAGAMVTP